MKIKARQPEPFATVSWSIEDVQTLRPEWSEKRCLEFLRTKSRHIQSNLVEHGWQVIESLCVMDELSN